MAAPQGRGRRGAAPWEQGRVLMAAGLAERAEKGQGLHGRRATTLQPGSASCCHPADALVLLFWALLDRKKHLPFSKNTQPELHFPLLALSPSYGEV